MPTVQKEAAVAELRERLQDNNIAILTKYIGITVAQDTQLRKQLRDAGVQYKVYKNTLGRRALAELGLENAANVMEGPTAWAFCKDPVAPAKILKEFAATCDKVQMVGGVMDRSVVVSKSQLDALASLPSREVLLGQVVGTIAAPMRNLVGALAGVPRNMVNVIDQIRQQKEGAAA